MDDNALRHPVRPRLAGRAVIVAVVGTLLVVTYAGLAALQILWLNPLAVAAEVGSTDVWADVAAAGERIGEPLVLGTLGIGPVIALVLLVVTVRSRIMTPVRTAMSYLALLALGIFGTFFAGFGPGMALADTYGTSGGDRSPWAIPLYLVSLAAVASLTVGGIVLVIRERHPSSVNPAPSPTA